MLRIIVRVAGCQVRGETAEPVDQLRRESAHRARPVLRHGSRVAFEASAHGNSLDSSWQGCRGYTRKLMSAAPRNAFVSVVIPVFNSEPILPKLIARLRPVLDSISTRWEVIMVND